MSIDSDYRKVDAVSNSGFKYLKRSVLHYKLWSKGLIAQSETAEMRFGSAFHAALLQPDCFQQDYIVGECDMRTKAGKALHERASAEGKHIVSPQNFADIEAMLANVRAHSEAKTLLNELVCAEQPIYWEESGVKCKGKPDGVTNNAVIEIKTSGDVSPDAFSYTAKKYGYVRQLAFYRSGLNYNRNNPGKIRDAFIIAIERQCPYAVAVYSVPQGALSLAWLEYQVLLRKLKESESLIESEFCCAYPGIQKLECSLYNPDFDED